MWGILGAMECEIELLHSKMEHKLTTTIAGIDYYQGMLEGKEIILARCGIGKVNAASCSVTMIQLFKATKIINVGVAGGSFEGAKVYDIILSDSAMYHDFTDGILQRNYPNTQIFQADTQLIALAKQSSTGLEKQGIHIAVGRIASGDIFVGDAKTKQDIINRINPMCIEMEGAAIAHICHIYQVPFLIIRSLSDTADNEADFNFDEFAKNAAQHSAKLLLTMLSQSIE
ncbi:MAG: 5'-methylthioadenosine/adenosylhomocysteine nucleosidase [Oscillospiraceae bacterium]